MNTHTLFANLHLGGAWIIVATLAIFYSTKRKSYERIAKSLTLLNVILFSAGATFAMTGLFFFIALYPEFISNALHIYWWPMFFEAITFGLEILFLYTFWFSWGKIGKKWHLGLGFTYAAVVFVQVTLINTLAAGMLTPNNGPPIPYTSQGIFTVDFGALWNFWWNATIFRLQFHRLAAAIGATGFLIAALAMFHYNDRKDIGSKRYWDWVASYGMMWGLIGIIFQPILGQLYFLQIQTASPDAFELMMHGPRAWAMLMVVGLLSALFISAFIYFLDRRERILSTLESGMIRKLYILFIVVAVIAAIVVVQPAWIGGAIFSTDPAANTWMLGTMDYKYFSLFALAFIGALVVMLDAIFIGDLKLSEWGNLPKAAQYAGIAAGILSIWIIPVMGYVREGGRSPWLLYQIIPVPGSMDFQTPIYVPWIVLTWIALTTLTLAIFWFTFRVIAHQPGEKEEIGETTDTIQPTTPLDYENQRNREDYEQ